MVKLIDFKNKEIRILSESSYPYQIGILKEIGSEFVCLESIYEDNVTKCYILKDKIIGFELTL